MPLLLAFTAPSVSRRHVEQLVKVAVVLVVASELVAEASYVWHQSRRAAASWLDRVQLREERRLCEAELGFLSGWLGRRR